MSLYHIYWQNYAINLHRRLKGKLRVLFIAYLALAISILSSRLVDTTEEYRGGGGSALKTQRVAAEVTLASKVSQGEISRSIPNEFCSRFLLTVPDIPKRPPLNTDID